MSESSAVRLEFEDFVDLQTRLVLLPRIEEEGVGAVVAAYTAKQAPVGDGSSVQNETKDTLVESQPQKDDESSKTEENESDAKEKDEREPKKDTDAGEGPIEHPEDSGSSNDKENDKQQAEKDTAETSCKEEGDSLKVEPQSEEANSDDGKETDALKEAGERDVTENDAADSASVVVGMMLSKITTSEPDSPVDCTEMDFTSILSTIREGPAPIVLFFEPPEEDSTSKKEDDASTATSTAPEEGVVVEEERPNTPPRSILSDRLSSWGSRVRQTSAILAAEAASGAASIVTAASEASEQYKANRVIAEKQSQTQDVHEEDAPKCSLFLQCTSGRFIPLSTSPTVTSSSVLLVRQSAEQACPVRGYEFQWYRSFRAVPSDRSLSSGSSSLNTGTVEEEEPTEWTMLLGANHAAYQPSATDVGHQLKCVATIIHHNDDDDDEKSVKEETVVCRMNSVVAADMPLFNGARQALARGAKFGNLVGRGKAEGRIFRVHIEMARDNNTDEHKSMDSMDVTSGITIFQISGNTAEPLNEEAILGATAVSDPSKPKEFELVIPSNTEAAAMVSALSTDDGHFQLEAPNRITRESLLLALGIANYKGKPADLSSKTVLFPDVPAVDAVKSEESPFKSPITKEVQFFTPQESCSSPDTSRVQDLEKELQRLRSKLARKDKVVSDLQRQLTKSDSKLEKTQASLSSCQADLEKSRQDCRSCQSSLRLAEGRIKTHDDTVQRIKMDHTVHVMSLEERITSQSEKIVEHEKSIRSLQNEKAVLSAAVEAREAKLAKMSDLQSAVESLSEKVSRGDAVKSELNDMSQRYSEISQDLEKVTAFEKECREELEQTRAAMEDLQSRLAKEQQKGTARQSQLEVLQVKTQKIQAERNNFKQKADSLSKEISRLCKNGMTLRDVEKIVLDEESRQMEVACLKAQKRQALDEAEQYRTLYEQTLVAQRKAGLDGEAVRALEQKADLERVVSEMTEYVTAKEMQLETLKQVNAALTEELHQLAQANMSKNDI